MNLIIFIQNKRNLELREMKNLQLLAILAMLLGSLLIYSCNTSETQALETSDVLGKWNLKEAYRGGKPTETLRGVYFEFMENGQAKTNFNLEGQDKMLTYEMKEGKILMKGDGSLDIKAEKDLDGNLTFNTSLQNYKFKLILEPAGEEK